MTNKIHTDWTLAKDPHYNHTIDVPKDKIKDLQSPECYLDTLRLYCIASETKESWTKEMFLKQTKEGSVLAFASKDIYVCELPEAILDRQMRSDREFCDVDYYSGETKFDDASCLSSLTESGAAVSQCKIYKYFCLDFKYYPICLESKKEDKEKPKNPEISHGMSSERFEE